MHFYSLLPEVLMANKRHFEKGILGFLDNFKKFFNLDQLNFKEYKLCSMSLRCLMTSFHLHNHNFNFHPLLDEIH